MILWRWILFWYITYSPIICCFISTINIKSTHSMRLQKKKVWDSSRTRWTKVMQSGGCSSSDKRIGVKISLCNKMSPQGSVSWAAMGAQHRDQRVQTALMVSWQKSLWMMVWLFWGRKMSPACYVRMRQLPESGLAFAATFLKAS